MDLATIVGLVVAWGAVVGALLLEGGSPREFLNIPAFILVIFGTIGAAAVGTSVKTLSSVPGMLRAAVTDDVHDLWPLIDRMVELAKLRRRQGVLALEEAADKIDSAFLKKGIELIVDGTPSVIVREILETEVVAMQERHKVGETLFQSLGGFSPTLGIIGTVMGLIGMLTKLSEPGKMGHMIAVAFVATLYGVAMANLAYLPIASKLRSKTTEEVTAYEMIIEGILSLQAGDNPRIVETRMMAFLPPRIRNKRTAKSTSDRGIARAA